MFYVLLTYPQQGTQEVRGPFLTEEDANTFANRQPANTYVGGKEDVARMAGYELELDINDLQPVRTPAEAAAQIIALDEFATNRQCLCALYGLGLISAEWSRLMGVSTAFGHRGWPDDIAAMVIEAQSIVATKRDLVERRA